MEKRNLCIIPARGGSKRIPRKNIKKFLGKPIIAYSIEIALNSGLFKEVMVSTDDEEIAEIAKGYGASVPFLRSSESSDDHAILADVIDEVKREYLLRKKRFDYICCILPTSPLITEASLNKGLKVLTQTNADSVRPVVEFNYPIQRAFKKKGSKVERFYPEFDTTRSQDLDKAFHDAGQFYWMRFDVSLRGGEKHAFKIEQMVAQDIDTLEDWKLAELKYKAVNE